MKYIKVKGAKEHNLKNISLDLPRDKFIVITGISGSGKSTLAFDTIFSEGQRRYLESLSSYARQFLGQMDKPNVDSIEGLSPTISIDQKSTSHNPRSTVGTVTEIHDYLRLLYAKIGRAHCPECGREISKLSTDEIVNKILDINDKEAVKIYSPVVRQRKGEYKKLLLEMFKSGYSEAIVDGKQIDLTQKEERDIELEKYKKHSIDILVDEVELNEKYLSRIFEAVENAINLSTGLVKVKTKDKEYLFNQNLSCPIHNISFPKLEPRFFSFNSPQGACKECEGLGNKKEIDPKLVIPDEEKTINEGAIIPWSNKGNSYIGTILKTIIEYYQIRPHVRFKDLNEYEKKYLLYGNDYPDTIEMKLRSKSGNTWKFNVTWRGIVGFLEDRYFKTTSDAVRRDIEKYMAQIPCSSCHGSRYNEMVLLVTIGEKNIYEMEKQNIAKTLEFLKDLKLNEKEELIAKRIIKEIISRLNFLNNVGLNYLTLERSANTLSGGESQRIRLASQIGSQLVGVLYILDEPSIGLHAKDNKKLLDTLTNLRDLGNTVLVVEHDEETIRKADHIVDIGPRAGDYGGRVVAEGSIKDILKNKKSLTGKYLRREKFIEVPEKRRNAKKRKLLSIIGASQHNLKNINVSIPLKTLTCVTGVSGSGKSTIVKEILYKGLSHQIMRSLDKPGRFKEMTGVKHISKTFFIDQSPIGRTPRSNPATYTGVFTPIRKIFAMTKEARMRGYKLGRFSFNVNGGRCDHCKGEGSIKVEMQFLPDVYLPCNVCKGARYNRETLEVKYKGKNIAEVLHMTVSTAKDFFKNIPEIHTKLKVLEDVGLGYIRLGQAATTLSGGEAQRVKLASELYQRSKKDILYILDEPTTGLHFDDIQKLLNILNRLVEAGNTVVVIEHNMDVIKTADYLIDLGPEGGDKGGKVVIAGTPEELAENSDISYTGKYLKKVFDEEKAT